MNHTCMKVIGSRSSDEWATPSNLFQALDSEFHFNLDPCASYDNRLCIDYFTKESDGLTQSWEGKRAFVNPPYSNVEAWVRKAYIESKNDNTLIVVLVPSRTDTKWFHKYVYNRCEIRFIKGRLKFGGKDNAPFPSLLAIYRGPGT